MPTSYAIEFSIVPAEPTFAAAIDIELDVRAAVDRIWLHASGLTVEHATWSQDGIRYPVKVSLASELLEVPLPHQVHTGPATLRLQYRGRLDDQRTDGVYRVAEPDGAFYAYTMFEPLKARRAFPCFDEPSFKVPWSLSFVLAGDDIAVANTSIVERIDLPDGRRKVVMAPTKPLPSYLVAFVVGPFEVFEAGNVGANEHALRFIVPRGRADDASLAYARAVTPRIIEALEEFFGIPYPYEKLDVAVVPRFWGTMEHPGIVALGAPITVIRPNEDSRARREAYTNTAIHELCHYWLGDLVTMDWWDDTWLNEGLGTWCDRHVTHSLQPDWGYDFSFATDRRAAMSSDSMSTAKRVREPIKDRSDIESSFSGTLTYLKGSAVARMFEHWMGAGAFRSALRGYLIEHAHGTARSEALYAALDQAQPGAGRALATFIEQPGIPLVDMTLDCSPGSAPAIALAQSRLQVLGVSAQATNQWQIPVCVRYGGGDAEHETCTLLATPAATIPLEGTDCPAWVIGNTGGYGYYVSRVHSTRAAALLAPPVTPVEQATVVADQLALVEAGKLSLADVLETLPPLVARATDRLLPHYMRLLAYAHWWAGEEGRPVVAAFIRELLAERAYELGWRRRPDEAPETEELRPTLVKLVGGRGADTRLRAEALALTQGHFAGTAAIDPSMISVAFDLAARSNDPALWLQFVMHARTTDDVSWRQAYYRALGAFTDPTLVQRSLSLLLDDAIDLRDSRRTLTGLFATTASRETAYKFLTDNFDALLVRSTTTYQKYLVGIVGYFCDRGHRADAEKFFASRVDRVEGGRRALDAGLEQVDICIAQRAFHAPRLDAFFATRAAN